MDYFKILNLSKEPFSNSPDPAFFFQSTQHKGCLQKLELATRLRRGLNVVIGDVGTGKTTLCRQFILNFASSDRDKEEIETHLFLDPSFNSPSEFLAHIATVFGIPKAGSEASDWGIKENIKNYLFKKGIDEKKTVVLIFDEGQKFPSFCLEILREFLNYETNDNKLLQIMIFAQKEFQKILEGTPNFTDRINQYYYLEPLNFRETKAMIKFRLATASESKAALPLFTYGGFRAIYKASGGYPRKIISLAHQVILALIIQNRVKAGYFMVRACASRVSSLPTNRLKWVVGTGLAAFILSHLLAGLGPDKLVMGYLWQKLLPAIKIGRQILGKSETGSGDPNLPRSGSTASRDLSLPRSGSTGSPDLRKSQTGGTAPRDPILTRPGSAGSPDPEKGASPATKSALSSTPLPPEEGGSIGQRQVSSPLRREGQSLPRTRYGGGDEKGISQPTKSEGGFQPTVTGVQPLVTSEVQGGSGRQHQAGDATPSELASKSSQDMLAPAKKVPEFLGRITVAEGMTMYGIIRDTYGDLSPGRLKSFLRANPSLTDPNLIKSGEIVTLPALPVTQYPLPPGKYWVQVVRKNKLEEAYLFLKNYPSDLPAIKLFPFWNSREGLVFTLLEKEGFVDWTSAANAIERLPLPLSSGARVLDKWDEDTVFFAAWSP